MLGDMKWGGSFARSHNLTAVYMTFIPNCVIQKSFPGFGDTLSNKTKKIALLFTMPWLNISNRVCKVSSALYIDVCIDYLRRDVVLIGLVVIIGLFVVIFISCSFYCIFKIHIVHCISFSLSATVFK